jgi:hypothetical protein
MVSLSKPWLLLLSITRVVSAQAPDLCVSVPAELLEPVDVVVDDTDVSVVWSAKAVVENTITATVCGHHAKPPPTFRFSASGSLSVSGATTVKLAAPWNRLTELRSAAAITVRGTLHTPAPR